MNTKFAAAGMVIAIMVGATAVLGAVPYASGTLQVETTMNVGIDMGVSNSVYNPRSFAGYNYVPQLWEGFARYPNGSDVVDKCHLNGEQMRMAGPFGGNSTTYVLAAGGSNNDYFSRLDFANLDNRVVAAGPADLEPNSFDWLDDDTVIFSSYENRKNLYLADIVAEPFSVALNTTWNANGYVTTSATTRIRNVRIGETYGDYAYYGDAGVSTAKFWAINLATGAETELGALSVTGDGSWGLWTVQEAGGYLYLHTSHDGIYVYNMTDATTLGSLFTYHTKAELDALVGLTDPSWGCDVVDGGARIVLGVGNGKTVELIPEPATLTLIALGGLGLLKRRRRK